MIKYQIHKIDIESYWQGQENTIQCYIFIQELKHDLDVYYTTSSTSEFV